MIFDCSYDDCYDVITQYQQDFGFLPYGSYLIGDSYDFNLVEGYNKVYFSDCYKWPFIVSNVLVLIDSPSTPSASPGYLAIDTTSAYRDFSYSLDWDDKICISNLYPNLGTALFQLIGVTVPDYTYRKLKLS